MGFQATDGVGRVAAGAFAHKNAHVVVHGRDLEKTKQCAASSFNGTVVLQQRVSAALRWHCCVRAVAEIKAESPNAKVDYILGDLTSFKCAASSYTCCLQGCN